MFAMEQCFRVALWMFVLTGYLQANSLKRMTGQGDLGLGYLQQVTCENVTFSTPKMKENCFHAALQCFQDGLDNAMKNCTRQDRIRDTLEALEDKANKVLPLANTAECTLEKVEFQFTEFVDALEEFYELLNSHPTKSKNP